MLLEISGEIRKNEGMESKQKHPVVDVTGDQVKPSAVKSNIAQELEC